MKLSNVKSLKDVDTKLFLPDIIDADELDEKE
jgi:hypothetical protein